MAGKTFKKKHPDPEELAAINSFGHGGIISPSALEMKEFGIIDMELSPSAKRLIEMRESMIHTMRSTMGVPGMSEADMSSHMHDLASLRHRVERRKEEIERERDREKHKALIDFTHMGKKFLYDPSMVEAAEKFREKEEKTMYERLTPRPASPIEDEFEWLKKPSATPPPSSDVEPDWEMDIASGAILQHDLVVDEKGNKFMLAGDKFVSVTSHGADAMKTTNPVGAIRVVSSAYAEEEPSLIPRGRGILDAMEDKTVVKEYTRLTMDTLKAAVDSVSKHSGGDEFIIHTGAAGERELSKAMKSAHVEETAKQQLMMKLCEAVEIMCDGRPYKIWNASTEILQKHLMQITNDGDDMIEEERKIVMVLIKAELMSRSESMRTKGVVTSTARRAGKTAMSADKLMREYPFTEDEVFSSSKGIRMVNGFHTVKKETNDDRVVAMGMAMIAGADPVSSPPISPNHGGGPRATDSGNILKKVTRGLRGLWK